MYTFYKTLMHTSEPAGSTSPDSKKTNRLRSFVITHWWVMVLFGFSLLLRLVYALLAPQIDPFLVRHPLMGDAEGYDAVARNLLEGEGYTFRGRPTAYHPILYPLFLAGVYTVFGYDLMIARLIQAVIAATLPVTLFLASRQLVNERVARLASIGVALYPLHIFYGAWLIAEALFLALVGGMLWVGISLQRDPSYLKAGLLGGVIGLAIMTKPVILVYLPFMVIFFLVSVAASFRKRLLLGVATACTILVVVSPQLVRNYRVFSELVLFTNGGYTFYVGNNEYAFGGYYTHPLTLEKRETEVAEQKVYYRRGLDWIRQNPTDFASLVFKKFQRLLSPFSVMNSPQEFQFSGDWLVRGLYYLFLLLACYGVYVSRHEWRSFVFLYIPIVGVLTTTVIFFGDGRFTLPAVPSLVVFCVLALQAISLRLGGRNSSDAVL